MIMYYILDGKQPKQIHDLEEWYKHFALENRILKKTKIGDAEVSTVFLGIDHAFGKGEPILFETMVFGGNYDQYTKRYSTWDEAIHGHQLVCEKIISRLN